jgi:putative ABC transport system permease protein
MPRLRIPYSLAMLWRDPHRFLPAVLAVAFSAVLIAVQCGLVLGLLLCTSAPIDHSGADLWVMTADAPSLPQAYPMPASWRLRLAGRPEIDRAEPYLVGPGTWHKPGKGSAEPCFIVGFALDEDSLGVLDAIPPDVRLKLQEPGTVVVDQWDLGNLGLRHGAGETAELNHRRVRVVGTVKGFQGHNFIYTFCSLHTARLLLPLFQQFPDTTMCLLARCRPGTDVPALVDALRAEYPDMGVYTREELSDKVRAYWLFRSTGGTVMLCTMSLALLVGLVVTSQTLHAAVLASLREYAVLDALGIPRWRLLALVLLKSLWIGLAGLLLSLPVCFLLSAVALLIRTRVVLPPGLLGLTVGLTLAMSALSGLLALRALRHVEPATLLR